MCCCFLLLLCKKSVLFKIHAVSFEVCFFLGSIWEVSFSRLKSKFQCNIALLTLCIIMVDFSSNRITSSVLNFDTAIKEGKIYCILVLYS